MSDELHAPAAVREGTFPKLTEEQRARIAVFARERAFADGDLLWEQGDDKRPLYVVLAGKVTVLSGADDFVTAHEPGQFSGDVDLVSGQPALVRGRATGATRVLELPADRLRALVQTDAELSEIFLRAFVLRRILLRTSGRPRTRSFRELFTQYFLSPMLTPRFAVGAVLATLFVVLLVNLGQQAYAIAPGERVAQMVIAPVSRATVEEAVELSSTERGAGGFGHTG